MCGRYTVTIDKRTIEKRFGARFFLAHQEFGPTYNAAPSQLLPIIRTYPQRKSVVSRARGDAREAST